MRLRRKPPIEPAKVPIGENDQKDTFKVIDLLRLLLGALCLVSFLSYWFTSSLTWGYRGKWLDVNFLKFKAIGRYVHLDPQQLLLFDGTDSRLPIYVAVNGKVFDVSASRYLYQPKGSYHMFAGKDGARALVTGCLYKPDEITYDLRGLEEDEATWDTLSQWQNYYESHPKYWYIGTVAHEKLEGDPPAMCKSQYPKMW